MNRFVIMVALFSMSCGCYNTDREKNAVMPARNRILNAFDGITIAIMSNTNRLKGIDFSTFVSEVADRDPVMKELLIKLPNGTANSPLILNTNIDAWLSPKQHKSEIAIVASQHIKIDGKYVCLGIRFDREIVCFSYLVPTEEK